jgi:hypothetical protein
MCGLYSRPTAPGMAAETPQAAASRALSERIYLRYLGIALGWFIAAARSCSEQPARVPK